ncbi:MAG: apolipoprotein N-acyltransferase [Woeseiaceae bacterium]
MTQPLNQSAGFSLKFNPKPLFESGIVGAIIVFIAGAFLALAFAPVNLYFLAVISLCVLFYALLFVTPLRAAYLGWWFGLGYFGMGVSWGFVAIYVFGLSSIFISALLTFLGIAFLSLYVALFTYLSILLKQKISSVKLQYSLFVIFPSLWALSEWFRGWFLTGFPWLSVGYSQTDSFLSGYAPVLGVFGISWLVALSASLLLILFLEKKDKFIYLILLLSIWLGGMFLSQVNWTQAIDKPIKVSLVQGNVEQENKWDPEQFEKRKQRYLSLTEKHWDSDLILWPENSLTIFYHQLDKNVLQPLSKKAKKNNTDIILGLPVLNKKRDEYFSSMMALGRSFEKDKPQFYHKSHLVPFGEYVPFESSLRGLISFFDLPMSGFTPGSSEQKLFTAAGQKIAPTICYEDAFGEDVIRFLPEATLLLNASNNAWYGDSFAPHQHVQISQMRALETGRDMMRVTTNGVSALINYKGKILKRSKQFEADVVTGMVQPRHGATPYVLWGNIIILLIITLGLLFIVIISYMKNSKENFIVV